MNYSLVIFDWDGTLMDSTGRIVSCLAAAAADVALPPLPPERLCSIIGLGLFEAIRELYPQAPEPLVQAMRDRYAVHFIAAEETPSALFEGVLETLRALRAHGVSMAVATGKSRRGLDRVWGATGLGHWFDSSRCADETRSKPHPDMVLELVAELGHEPARTLMVGDTSFDLEMAQRASVDRVGVTYGAHPPEQLALYQPLMLLERIDGLLPLVIGAEPQQDIVTGVALNESVQG